MNKAERDFRLQQVREEKAKLQRQLDKLELNLDAENARSQAAIRRMKEHMKQPWYKRLFTGSGTSSGIAEGLGGMDALMADELEKRIRTLTEQEARLIGMPEG